MILILILLCLFLSAILISIYENRHFVVRRYEINNSYFKDKDVRIVFLSDLHDCSYGKDNEKLIDSIVKEKPDIVIFGGDIFNGIRNKKNVNAAGFIEKISEKFTSFYALGNHEFRYYLYPDEFPGCKEEFERIINNNNIILLDNNKKRISINQRNIDLYGLTIDREYYKRLKTEKMDKNYVAEKLGVCDKNAYSILLAHNPQYFNEYCEFGADLVLSGHYHGGIMRFGKQGVVSPAYKLFPKYSYGLINSNKSKLIVSGGLGVHTIPFRIFNRPEIVVIDLKG